MLRLEEKPQLFCLYIYLFKFDSVVDNFAQRSDFLVDASFSPVAHVHALSAVVLLVVDQVHGLTVVEVVAVVELGFVVPDVDKAVLLFHGV